MTNNDLLLAISDIMEAKMEPLRKEIQQTKTELHSEILKMKNELRTEFKNDINELRAEFKNDINELRAEFKNDINELRAEFKNDINELRAEFKKLEDKLDNVAAALQKQIAKNEKAIIQNTKDISNINILLENEVMPRLRNIESCYVATSNRYISSINQIESIQSDVDVLKNVVAEHSVKLQKIS